MTRFRIWKSILFGFLLVFVFFTFHLLMCLRSHSSQARCAPSGTTTGMLVLMASWKAQYTNWHKSGPPSRSATRTADASFLRRKDRTNNRQQQKNRPVGSSQLDQHVYATGKLELEWHVRRWFLELNHPNHMQIANCLCSVQLAELR